MIQLQSNILRIANLILFGLLSIPINSETIYDIAASNGNFSTLATALELTELDSVLDCEYFFCSYTVFAPSDDAFNALPDGTLDKLITDEWKAHLRGILLYHVAYGLFPSTGIQDKGQVITLSFETLNTTMANNEVKINDAIVTSADIEASNGLIHVIDKVLLPSFMQNDIIATATKAGIFGTLLAAVDAADLTQALQGSGPFTLFAPTDDAFQKLGDTKIQELLQDIPSLSEILTYHVIPEKIILSHDLNKESNLTTLQGESIQVNKWKFWFFEYLHLNENVNIVSTDILTSNGVIHVVRVNNVL
jgi:transforming growth factor-beta-induced protein